MPTGYVLIFYWTIVALGAALFLGTGAALLRYRHTGAFPGLDAAHEPSRRDTRRAVLRCVVGMVLTAGGAAGLLVGD